MRHQRNRLIDINNGESMSRSHLLRSMLTSLIKHGRVTTTSKKAKALKAYTDNFFAKLVWYMSDKDNGTRHAIALIKSVVYSEEDGKRALNERTPRFVESKKIGWYTEMFKLWFRKGDTAEKIMIKLS